jgi:hypothetical protein
MIVLSLHIRHPMESLARDTGDMAEAEILLLLVSFGSRRPRQVTACIELHFDSLREECIPHTDS